MEDPWGDPWATPVTIDLAPAPAPAEGAGGWLGAKAGEAAAPWRDGEGDAWTEAGEESGPGWATDPGLETLTSAWADPWAADADAPITSREPDDTAGNAGAGTAGDDDDAGAGRLGARGSSPNSTASLRRPRAASPDASAHDVWAAREPSVAADGEAAVGEQPPPPASPAAAPPGSAAAAKAPLGRAQGLVDLFDGMVRRSTSSTATAAAAGGDRTAASCLDPGRDSALESGEGDGDELPRTRAADADGPKARASFEELRGDVRAPDDGSEDTPGLGDGQDQLPPRGKMGTVAYPIELSLLDEVFPSTPTHSSAPERLTPLAGDGFTSASERKVWYRMSRPGSMRRHDQGDADDYVHVGWAASRVRQRTMELVRRWLEQEALGQRVVQGRRIGAGGGSMFNWDSTAAATPVEIAELLRSRRRGGRSPGAHSRGVSAATVDEPATAAAAPRPGSLRAEPGEDSHAQAKGASSAAAALAAPPDAAPPATSLVGAPAASEEAGWGEADDDDDWGDMVSPTAAEPTFDVAHAVGAGSSSRDSDQSGRGDAGCEGAGEAGGTGACAAKRRRAPSPDHDSSLSWAWEGAWAPETTEPALPRATPNLAPLTRETTRRPLPGGDGLSRPPPPPGTSADDAEASRDADAAVVGAILRGLADLTYMLR